MSILSRDDEFDEDYGMYKSELDFEGIGMLRDPGSLEAERQKEERRRKRNQDKEEDSEPKGILHRPF